MWTCTLLHSAHTICSFVRSFAIFVQFPRLAFCSGRFHFRFRLALCMNDFCEKRNVFVFRFCLYNMFVPVSSSSLHSASGSSHLNPVKLLQAFSFLILNMNRKCLVHKHTFRAQFYFSGFSYWHRRSSNKIIFFLFRRAWSSKAFTLYD